MASNDSWRRAVVRALVWSVLGSIALGALLSAHHGVTLETYLVTAAISLLYSVSISVPATLMFRWLERRLPGLGIRQWLIYLGVLLALSALGIFGSGLVLVAVGLTSLDDLWRDYFLGLQIATAITAAFMAGAVSFAKLRARLADSERSLDDTERDRRQAIGLATEARLASLESRVRPHFLFNALNSAIALIPEDPSRAEKLLERLASLLRSSLDVSSGTVLLHEELRLVTDYLEVERVRFGDRLQYEIDVPEELHGVSIPAFAVQTLVENSVKYAVSARKAGARIAVRARRDGDRMRLDVCDDGPGFTGPIWVTGHGLDGLRARLEALYGEGARLLAPAQAASGAAVAIELPVPARPAVAR